MHGPHYVASGHKEEQMVQPTVVELGPKQKGRRDLSCASPICHLCHAPRSRVGTDQHRVRPTAHADALCSPATDPKMALSTLLAFWPAFFPEPYMTARQRHGQGKHHRVVMLRPTAVDRVTGTRGPDAPGSHQPLEVHSAATPR